MSGARLVDRLRPLGTAIAVSALHLSCGGGRSAVELKAQSSGLELASLQAPVSSEVATRARRESCPRGMALIPARTGKEAVPAYKRKTPLREFCVGSTEATVVDWGDCVRAGECEWPAFEGRLYPEPWERMGTATWIMGNPAMPINYIDHPTAEAFCKWMGGRLPTKEEWEWAYASARADYNVPWGEYHLLPEGDDSPNALPKGPVCRSVEHVILRSMPCPVASNTGDETLQGIFDMSANLQEWTSTPFAETMFSVGGDDFTRKGRFIPNGGAFPPHNESASIGVRCAAQPRK